MVGQLFVNLWKALKKVELYIRIYSIWGKSYRDIKNELSYKNITCIYIYANNSTIKKRLEKRGDNPNEVIRRMGSDNEDFKGFENEVDRIVYNNDGDNIDDVVSKILKYLEEVKK